MRSRAVHGGYDEGKFTEAVLYVAKRLEQDPAGGAMKLNKVLFHADFGHMRAHGRTITGATYQKLRSAPPPAGSSRSGHSSSPTAKLNCAKTTSWARPWIDW